jgi:hypothetical protein
LLCQSDEKAAAKVAAFFHGRGASRGFFMPAAQRWSSKRALARLPAGAMTQRIVALRGQKVRPGWDPLLVLTPAHRSQSARTGGEQITALQFAPFRRTFNAKGKPCHDSH